MDQDVAPIPTPYVDEAAPGLGRRSGVPADARRQSGNLPDEPEDDPVRDTHPFRPKAGGGR